MRPDFKQLAKETLEELGVIPDLERTEYMAQVLRKQYEQGVDSALRLFYP